MKKLLSILIFAVTLSLLAGASSTFAQNTRISVNASEEDIILAAIPLLTESWKEDIFNDGRTSYESAKGFLGIRNVRVIWIKDTLGEFEDERTAGNAELP